jgi:hypothetical protein
MLLKALKRLTYPHKKNRYRAKALHLSSLSFFIYVFLFFQIGLSLFTKLNPQVLGFAAQLSPQKILDLTNQKRLEAGLPPLALNENLTQAAQQKASDMFAYNYWAHYSPDGRSPWSFISNAGYQYTFAGENLARDFGREEDIVSAWMASPTHRDNLLNSKYQDIGLAIIDGTLKDRETTLVVQLFGAQSTKKGISAVSTVQAKTKGISQELSQSYNLSAVTQQKSPNLSLFSSFDLTKSVSMAIIMFLLFVLFIDGYVYHRQKIPRLTGHNFTHWLFLFLVLVIIWLTTQGVIL